MRKTIRISPVKDKDLYEILNNCKDVTKAVKYYMRRGLAINVPITLEYEDIEPILVVEEDIPDEEIIDNIISNSF